MFHLSYSLCLLQGLQSICGKNGGECGDGRLGAGEGGDQYFDGVCGKDQYSRYRVERGDEPSNHWTIDQYIDRSIGQSIDPSIDTLIHPSIDHSIDLSIDRSIDRSIHRSMHWSIHRSIHQSIESSIHRSINPSIESFINPSIDWSIDGLGDGMLGAGEGGDQSFDGVCGKYQCFYFKLSWTSLKIMRILENKDRNN